MLMECCVPPHWEAQQTPFGTIIEPTSTEKCQAIFDAYRGAVIPGLPAASASTARAQTAGPWCIGTFAFVGGHKFEGTETWYSMITHDGAALIIDRWAALSLAWRGAAPTASGPGAGAEYLALRLASVQLPSALGIRATAPTRSNAPTVPAGTPITLEAWTVAPDSGSRYEALWFVQMEGSQTVQPLRPLNPQPVTIQKPSAGDVQAATAQVTVSLQCAAPAQQGSYRVYCYLFLAPAAGNRSCASCSLSLRVL
jgi:hypothetical protein